MEQGLNIKGAGLYHIQGAAKWAKIIAIIAAIMMALVVILGIKIMSIQFGAGLLYIIIAAIYIYPILMSFSFNSHINKAVASQDDNELETGLSNLRSLFTFMGVLSIIGLIFTAIGVISVIAAGNKLGLI